MSSTTQTTLSNSEESVTANEIRRLYVSEELSTYKVADRLGLSREQVRYRLQKYGICRSEQLADKPTEEELRAAYKKEGSIRGVWEGSDLSRHWCIRLMNYYGIEREVGPSLAEPCPFHTQLNGYEVWSHPDSKKFNGRTVPVHRLAMVAEHGLEALKGKYVHHKNHIKWDNRPANLELTMPDRHIEEHQRGAPISVELARLEKDEVVAALLEAGHDDLLKEK